MGDYHNAASCYALWPLIALWVGGGSTGLARTWLGAHSFVASRRNRGCTTSVLKIIFQQKSPVFFLRMPLLRRDFPLCQGEALAKEPPPRQRILRDQKRELLWTRFQT